LTRVWQPQLKNNTDHAAASQHATSNDSQTYYQGELDNVVVQQKNASTRFWSQYGTGLREEHKDDGLLESLLRVYHLMLLQVFLKRQ
jgi:hypothetical protein